MRGEVRVEVGLVRRADLVIRKEKGQSLPSGVRVRNRYQGPVSIYHSTGKRYLYSIAHTRMTLFGKNCRLPLDDYSNSHERGGKQCVRIWETPNAYLVLHQRGVRRHERVVDGFD